MPKEVTGKELLSDDIREIISYQPHWIVRKGNTIFCLVLFFLLMLAFVIKYPDVVNAPAKLTAVNPPMVVNAKKGGRLIKLFVSNEQQVSKGLHLGCIESGVEYAEAMKLQQWVDKTIKEIQVGKYNTLLTYPLPELINLGSLQVSYQEFENQLQYTKQTLANGYFNKKSNALQKDLQYLSAIKNNAYQQQDLISADKQLQQKEYEVYELLAKDKVIAPMELNQFKSKLIAKEQNLKQVDVVLTNTDITSHSKQKEILDLHKQVADQQQTFYSSLLNLKSMIEEWVEQFVLIASENGKLVFSSSLLENELVSAGQNLFYIVPPQSQFYVEITASQNGLGKIKPGQKVMLKVNSYPSQEFGSITGTVSYISDIPNNKDSFMIKANLPGGMQTNYGKTIIFKTGLTAQAEIITDDRKLIDRLTGQLRNVLLK